MAGGGSVVCYQYPWAGYNYSKSVAGGGSVVSYQYPWAGYNYSKSVVGGDSVVVWSATNIHGLANWKNNQ